MNNGEDQDQGQPQDQDQDPKSIEARLREDLALCERQLEFNHQRSKDMHQLLRDEIKALEATIQQDRAEHRRELDLHRHEQQSLVTQFKRVCAELDALRASEWQQKKNLR